MTSHDALFKRFLSNLPIAKEFLETYLPTELKNLCDFSTLEIKNTSLIEPKLHQHYADILYSLTLSNNSAYIYVLIEHQSTPDPLMAFRLWRYKISIMQQHLEQSKSNKLPLVIPLLFYAGRIKPYPHSLEIIDCFEQPDLAQHLFYNTPRLIDVTQLSEDEIIKHKQIALLEMVLKHIFTRDMINLAHKIACVVQHPIVSHSLFQDVLEYVITHGDTEKFQTFFDTLSDEAKHYQGDIMNIAERLIQKGKQQGIEQGIEQGLEQGATQGIQFVAKNMLSQKMPLSLISQLTGLSQEELLLLSTQ